MSEENEYIANMLLKKAKDYGYTVKNQKLQKILTAIREGKWRRYGNHLIIPAPIGTIFYDFFIENEG